MDQLNRSPFATVFLSANPLVVFAVGLALLPRSLAQDDLSADHSPPVDQRPQETIKRISDATIVEAFKTAHEGWSVDELLIQDVLRANFLNAFRSSSNLEPTEVHDKQLLERLIQLRKAGKLPVKSIKRSHSESTKWLPVAEIASRQMMDRFQANVDQWLVDPTLLDKFDAAVQSIAPESNPEEVRRAALRLRKSRRLKPELMARVVDWKRDIISMSVEQAAANLDELPQNAGIYIFSDKTGFLYIGQSNNLRTRLTKHLDQSDRKSLFEYLRANSQDQIALELHVFAKDSPANDTAAREAYESDLIRTRKPRFNVAP